MYKPIPNMYKPFYISIFFYINLKKICITCKYIQLETKKNLPLSPTFFVLTISLLFLDLVGKRRCWIFCGVKILFVFCRDWSYQFWFKNHNFFSHIQKCDFSSSDKKKFSFLTSWTFIDYSTINFLKINGFPLKLN